MRDHTPSQLAVGIHNAVQLVQRQTLIWMLPRPSMPCSIALRHRGLPPSTAILWAYPSTIVECNEGSPTTNHVRFDCLQAVQSEIIVLVSGQSEWSANSASILSESFSCVENEPGWKVRPPVG